MNHRLLLALMTLTLVPADLAAAAGPDDPAATPAATPTPMATPAPKGAAPAAKGQVTPAPGQAAGNRAARTSHGATQPRKRRSSKPGDARGKGPRIPPSKLALPQAAPHYDQKGRYLPTIYIYQETNGEFRILSPGGNGGGAPARPAASATPRPDVPAGAAQGSPPAEGATGGSAEAAGSPSEAPRP
ncbi:MAG: hypothetical protein VKQ33_09660 [Candidatus Sericytochromatia bacterium]|nr:hypothetical protein [Candidatus Sericytochromatia bacterium]